MPEGRSNILYRYIAITLMLALLFVMPNSCVYASGVKNKNTANLVVDNIIGSTFKTLAKAFVAVTDIEKLKKDNIERLQKMDEQKFHIRYLKVYSVIDACPYLSQYCGLSENISKDKAIKSIIALDKNKIYEIIEVLPNEFITSQFKTHLSQQKQKIQDNISLQIRRLWNNIIKNAYKN